MTLHDDATDQGFCWHQAQTPFEGGCYVLWELSGASTLVATERGEQGMTRQQYVDTGKHPGEEAFAMYKFFSPPETRAGVLAHGELPDALFGRLLEAYVETACEYGPVGTQLCSGREPFKPAAEFKREIGALVACGYAERRGDMVEWTDKIAPVMQVANYWNAPSVLIPDESRAQVEGLIRSGQRLAAAIAIRHLAKVGITQAQAHVDELEGVLQRTDNIAPVMHAPTGRNQITLPPEVLERVNMLVHDHNPIAAIALVRETTGADLVACKTYVDELARKSHRMPLHRPRM